jgi:nucleoside-diphosphate-sugar epimerase
MKVLLTGATGFIGSAVARVLVRRGHEVHALVRPQADTWRIADLAGQLETIAGDLASAQLGERLETLRPEACVHVAWYTVPGRYLDGPENLDHLELSLRLARTLARAGCRRFVGVGTCLEYAVQDAPLTESDPSGPARLYSATKLALGQLLPYVGAMTGMSTAWARLFYVYGPFEDERRLVPSVIRSLLRGEPARVSAGTQVRDYLHVCDMASALEAITRSSLQGAVNVGSGEPSTVRDVVLQLGQLLDGVDRLQFGAVPPAPGDPRYVCADIRRLVGETDFRPRFALQDGLRDTVEWWSERVRAAPLEAPGGAAR